MSFGCTCTSGDYFLGDSYKSYLFSTIIYLNAAVSHRRSSSLKDELDVSASFRAVLSFCAPAGVTLFPLRMVTSQSLRQQWNIEDGSVRSPLDKSTEGHNDANKRLFVC